MRFSGRVLQTCVGTGLVALAAAAWLFNHSYCPRCGTALEILPHLPGTVTNEGHQQQLAGEVVHSGTCIASSPHVLVCRRCRRYREPDAWTWRSLPRDFGTIAPKQEN